MDGVRLPERFFAAGHEPSGERVNTYLKANRIESIMKALEPDEVSYLQGSPFGTVLRTAELPPFSGSFARFLIGKLLKVNKKHEIWFLFAGNPIRFSIREYALVTGLNCDKFPKKVSKKRRRNPMNEKPYWPELFGTLKSCTVDKAVEMLKKKKVKDKETRLKFACLAITSAVLMPQSHYPKIMEEHVELVRDLTEFFKFPWGRAAFDVLITNIKSKDAVALSQSTVAFRGFVHSIQLVMIAAVPSLMEVVQITDSASSGESASESEEEDNGDSDDSIGFVSSKKKSNDRLGLSPGHARVIDEECKVDVQSIDAGPEIDSLRDVDLTWSDDDEDDRVDTMVRLIEGGFKFKRGMFKGGLTVSEIEQLRAEKKQKEKEGKEKKDKEKTTDVEGDGNPDIPQSGVQKSSFLDHEVLARLVSSQLKVKLQSYIEDTIKTMQSAIIDGILKGLQSDPNSFRNICDGYRGVATQRQDAGQFEVNKDLSTDRPIEGACVEDTMRRSKDSLTSAPFSPEEPLSFGTAVDKQPPQQRTGVTRTTGVQSVGEGENGHGSHLLSDPAVIEEGQIGYIPPQSTSSMPPYLETAADIVGPAQEENIQVNSDASLPPPQSTVQELQPVVFAESAAHKDTSTVLPPSSLASSSDDVNEDINPDTVLVCPTPTFSLGMTQSEIPLREDGDNGLRKPQEDLLLDEPMMNKRAKTTSLRLKDYHCPEASVKKHQATQVQTILPGGVINYEETFEKLKEKYEQNPLLSLENDIIVDTADILGLASRTYPTPPRVVDALMHYSSCLLRRKWIPDNPTQMKFLDSTFSAQFTKFNLKFTKTAIKDRGRLKYPDTITKHVKADEKNGNIPDRLYFPVNLDKNHWVGVCVNIVIGNISVLDCNFACMSDTLVKKDLSPVANILPYAINAANGGARKVHEKAFAISRLKEVPQNVRPEDSAITSVFLIQAHAIGGVDGCKCITQESLTAEAKKLVVMFFDEFGESI